MIHPAIAPKNTEAATFAPIVGGFHLGWDCVLAVAPIIGSIPNKTTTVRKKITAGRCHVPGREEQNRGIEYGLGG